MIQSNEIMRISPASINLRSIPNANQAVTQHSSKPAWLPPFFIEHKTDSLGGRYLGDCFGQNQS